MALLFLRRTLYLIRMVRMGLAGGATAGALVTGGDTDGGVTSIGGFGVGGDAIVLVGFWWGDTYGRFRRWGRAMD